MIIEKIKQPCLKCKGTGVGKNILKDNRGKVILAPPYQKGEGDRPQYENCAECDGEGMTLQDPPTTIYERGVKKTLTPEEAVQRYQSV